MSLVFQTMIFSVLLLAGDCNSKKPSPDSDSPTFARTVKDTAKSVGQAAKTVGDNAWKLSKDTVSTVSGIFTKSTNQLGPDPEVAVETNSDQSKGTNTLSEADEANCLTDEANCPADEANCLAGPDEANCPSDENDDLKGHDFDLSVVDTDEGVFSQLLDIASSSVSTVYKTAKENIYDNGARLMRNFSKIVREIVHEELYVFLQTVLSGLGASLLTPGATLYYLGQAAMTIVLVVICLLLSYVFLFRVSIFIILGGNASVYLVHQFMGPIWIFDWMFTGLSQFTWILRMTYRHPYIAAVCLVALFVYFIVFPVVRMCTQRGPEQRVYDLEKLVLDISRRLGEVETKQTEMLEKMDESHKEMLDILRRLDTNEAKR